MKNKDLRSARFVTDTPTSTPAKLRQLKSRFNAAIIAVILSALPTLIGGGLAYRSAVEVIEQQTADEKASETQHLATEFDQFLEARIAEVQAIADFLGQDNNDTSAPFTEETSAPLIDSTSASSPIIHDAPILLRNDDRDLPREVVSRSPLEVVLAERLKRYTLYTRLTVYGVDGRQIAQAQELQRFSKVDTASSEPPAGSSEESLAASAQQLRSQSYFQQAFRTQRPVISEPMLIEDFNDEPHRVILMAMVLPSPLRKPTELLVAELPAEVVDQALFASLGRRAGGSQGNQISNDYWLIDSLGQIWQTSAETAESWVGSPLKQHLPFFQTANRARKSQAWKGKDHQVYAYAPIGEKSTKLNWSLVSVTQLSPNWQQQLWQKILLNTVLAALAAALVAVIVTNRAMHSLQEITQVIQKLGQEKWGSRSSTKGVGEVAELGQSVNQLAATMQGCLEEWQTDTALLSRQQGCLLNPALIQAIAQGNAQAAAKILAPVVAQTLALERVSVWQHTGDRLRCLEDHHLEWPAQPEGSSGEVTVRRTLHKPNNTVGRMSIAIRSSQRELGLIKGQPTVNAPRLPANQAAEQAFLGVAANLMAIAIENGQLHQEISDVIETASYTSSSDLTLQTGISHRCAVQVANGFEQLLGQFTQMMDQVWATSTGVAGQVSHQAELAGQLSHNVQQQVKAIQRILQLNEATEQMAKGTLQQMDSTNKSLLSAQKSVTSGRGASALITQEIDSLRQSTDRIVQQMKALGEFVGLADEFVHEQSSISSRTQTLALNASLVAARASEQQDSQKFTAVAREFGSITHQIRQLAQQTDESVEGLEKRSAQIYTVVATIDAGVQKLGDSVSRLTKGIAQSNAAFDSLQVMTSETAAAGAQVTASNQKIETMTQAAFKQAVGISQLAGESSKLTKTAQTQVEKVGLLSQELLQTVVFFQSPNGKREQALSGRLDRRPRLEKPFEQPPKPSS